MLLNTHPLFWSLLWAAGSALLATAFSLRSDDSESSTVSDGTLVIGPREIFDTVNYNPNGSPYLWLPQDEHAGKTFFE